MFGALYFSMSLSDYDIEKWRWLCPSCGAARLRLRHKKDKAEPNCIEWRIP